MSRTPPNSEAIQIIAHDASLRCSQLSALLDIITEGLGTLGADGTSRFVDAIGGTARLAAAIADDLDTLID